MFSMKQMNVGIIGCGKISDAYFAGAGMFDILKIVACADLNNAVAEAKAQQHGIKAMSVKDLLADSHIDAVINLTIPAVHAEVSEQVLQAGKHVYCEKPLAVLFEDGKRIVTLAKEKDLRIGCAPDTFLGAGLQTSRKIIDDGWIGKPQSGTVFMLSSGPESWHPNPAFYYQVGGGPLFDMGPYYLTALIHLLGPIRSIMGSCTKAREKRVATCPEKRGLLMDVDVPTHYTGVLHFESGEVITASFSFDVKGSKHKPIEIHGSEGTVLVPDPNTFCDSGTVFRPHAGEWVEFPQSHIYSDNSRGIGLADMAYAIQEKRSHRCNGDMALHVLEAMHAFEKSSSEGRVVALETTCEKPAPLATNLIFGRL